MPSVGYTAAHARTKARRGPASLQICCWCLGPADHWAYDHSDPDPLISAKGFPYTLDPARYIAICARDHRTLDRLHKRNASEDEFLAALAEARDRYPDDVLEAAEISSLKGIASRNLGQPNRKWPVRAEWQRVVNTFTGESRELHDATRAAIERDERLTPDELSAKRRAIAEQRRALAHSR